MIEKFTEGMFNLHYFFKSQNMGIVWIVQNHNDEDGGLDKDFPYMNRDKINIYVSNKF